MDVFTYQEVLARDDSSGRIHVKVRRSDGKLLTFEGCNADEAGAWTEIDAAALAAAEPGQLCENEWPPVGGDDSPD